MILTLMVDDKTCTMALRPDTAEYLLSASVVDPKDWRIKDLIVACWAAAQQLKDKE